MVFVDKFIISTILPTTTRTVLASGPWTTTWTWEPSCVTSRVNLPSLISLSTRMAFARIAANCGVGSVTVNSTLTSGGWLSTAAGGWWWFVDDILLLFMRSGNCWFCVFVNKNVLCMKFGVCEKFKNKSSRCVQQVKRMVGKRNKYRFKFFGRGLVTNQPMIGWLMRPKEGVFMIIAVKTISFVTADCTTLLNSSTWCSPPYLLLKLFSPNTSKTTKQQNNSIMNRAILHFYSYLLPFHYGWWLCSTLPSARSPTTPYNYKDDVPHRLDRPICTFLLIICTILFPSFRQR